MESSKARIFAVSFDGTIIRFYIWRKGTKGDFANAAANSKREGGQDGDRDAEMRDVELRCIPPIGG